MVNHQLQLYSEAPVQESLHSCRFLPSDHAIKGVELNAGSTVRNAQFLLGKALTLGIENMCSNGCQLGFVWMFHTYDDIPMNNFLGNGMPGSWMIMPVRYQQTPWKSPWRTPNQPGRKLSHVLIGLGMHLRGSSLCLETMAAQMSVHFRWAPQQPTWWSPPPQKKNIYIYI